MPKPTIAMRFLHAALLEHDDAVESEDPPRIRKAEGEVLMGLIWNDLWSCVQVAETRVGYTYSVDWTETDRQIA